MIESEESSTYPTENCHIPWNKQAKESAEASERADSPTVKE